jgi:hypothetical protein
MAEALRARRARNRDPDRAGGNDEPVQDNEYAFAPVGVLPCFKVLIQRPGADDRRRGDERDEVAVEPLLKAATPRTIPATSQTTHGAKRGSMPM